MYIYWFNANVFLLVQYRTSLSQGVVIAGKLDTSKKKAARVLVSMTKKVMLLLARGSRLRI